jgi:hypothetical protein
MTALALMETLQRRQSALDHGLDQTLYSSEYHEYHDYHEHKQLR